MSLSASTKTLSSLDDNAILDKNLSSQKLVIARTASILLSEQIHKRREKFENYVNKNGALKFKIKFENERPAYLSSQPKIYKSFSQVNELNSNCPLNYQSLPRDSNYFEAKQLEFKTPTLQDPRTLFTPQQLQLYQKTYFGNYIPDRISFPNTIFVSTIFNRNLESNKNFSFTQSYPNLLRIPRVFLKSKEKANESLKEKEKIIQIKPKEKTIPNELVKLYFNIPDEFLIHYKIKKIEINDTNLIQSTDNPEKINSISFQDMEIFINNLFQNKLKIYYTKNENSFEEGYIKLDVPLKEENSCDFLHKKRKLSLDNEETYSKTKNKVDMYDASYRKHPLKNKHKKINKLTKKLKNIIKLNNKKNGLYTCVNLNQIQINKSNLEDFPFHSLLNSKEITKISFLKGLTENKDLIRINKKTGIAKDIKTNRSFFNNKLFKIEFQNKNETSTYIVHIYGIHILYLILYYYFQIHKSMKQINVYHYSHSAFRKSLDEIKKIENIIKNCNSITNSI